MNAAQLQPYIAFLKSEADVVLSTIKDRGSKRFSKVFVIAGFMVAGSYMLLLKPPMAKLARLQSRIDKAKTLSEYGAQYKDYRDQLSAAYAALPATKDRQEWLSNALLDSLRADGLLADNFRPIAEEELSGLVFQTASTSLTLEFPKFFSWLTRVESAKPMMHVQSFSIEKKADSPGTNTLSCDVLTVIPKRRLN